jgi:hypothetical protein
VISRPAITDGRTKGHIMFLPFETSLNFWLGQNIYGWEPEQPAADPAGGTGDGASSGAAAGADPDGASSCTPTGLPAMRLVFKGVKWTAYPVFGLRENVGWEQVAQARRDTDEEQRDDARREALKPRPPVPKPHTD